MSDAPRPRNQTALTNFWRSLKALALVLLIVLLGQLYLNEPTRRPTILCYPLYKLHGLVWITVVEFFVPRDDMLVITHIQDNEAFYFGCKDYAAKLPYFEPAPRDAQNAANARIPVPDSLVDTVDKMKNVLPD